MKPVALQIVLSILLNLSALPVFAQLTSETTPTGTVFCTYDDLGRRTTMTVSGQSQISYGYDAASRLTSISQNGQTTITYDAANRRDLVVLPNGVSIDYFWDIASRLKTITYRDGGTVIGDISADYNAASQLIALGGSLAPNQLPAADSGRTYSLANQLTGHGTTTYAYNADGNLTNDGTNWS